MHYYHLIIAPKEELMNTTPQEYAERRMAPFREHSDAPPSSVPCHCVGQLARDAAEAHADKWYGNYKEMRADHERFCDAIDASRKDDGLPPMTQEERQEIYIKVYITPREHTVRDFFMRHKLRKKPKPTCGFYVGRHWEDEAAAGRLDPALLGKRYEDNSGCGGTGRVTSTYNPDGHWDYWSLGGRWTGQLDGYDPTKDEANIETCWLCNGTGTRSDAIGISMRHENPAFTCNGCQGTGKQVKWPSKWGTHVGDIQPVAALVGHAEHVPYSLILPDGTWLQEPYSWREPYVEVDVRKAWCRRVLGIFKKYAVGHVAIVIDYHS